jgi:hypothetical protein
MSPETSRNVANLVMAAAFGAAVYVVLRTPALRRLAWQAARVGATATLPAFLARETRAAWEASGQRP